VWCLVSESGDNECVTEVVCSANPLHVCMFVCFNIPVFGSNQTMLAPSFYCGIHSVKAALTTSFHIYSHLVLLPLPRSTGKICQFLVAVDSVRPYNIDHQVHLPVTRVKCAAEVFSYVFLAVVVMYLVTW
jgi:hypothetical protein